MFAPANILAPANMFAPENTMFAPANIFAPSIFVSDIVKISCLFFFFLYRYRLFHRDSRGVASDPFVFQP